jgi:hypothetical protein
MATTKRRSRARKPRELNSATRALLYDEPLTDPWWWLSGVSEETWKANRGDVLRFWIREKPGTRPYYWWVYDAPRWLDDDCWPEPRRRVGGRGTPCYEVLAHAPNFEFGIPPAWVRGWSIEYYNGRAVDVHGERIGTQHSEGDFPAENFDPSDPPRFESQTAYLDRHGLLLPGERRRLGSKDFDPETLPAEFWPVGDCAD